MARPIWTGTLSFGLLNVPVSLMSGERRTDLHFRMLDSRDRKPVRYERVNAETGEEVPWKDVVKAYEYDKGSYVVLEEADIKAAAPESHETVEVETFVDAAAIDPRYYEKPYVLVPAKKAEKGYVLLRETLRGTGKAGIARQQPGRHRPGGDPHPRIPGRGDAAGRCADPDAAALSAGTGRPGRLRAA